MDAASSSGLSSRNIIELLLLASLWGGSFLLLRVTAPAFGPVFLIEMRVLMGLVVLLPIMLFSGKQKELIANWRTIALVSLTNMCLPFCLLAFASLSLNAGMISILNATVPFFAAVTGIVLFGQRLTVTAFSGLLIGFAGVVVLMAGDTRATGMGTGLLAFAAGLAAAFLYGFSTNIINRSLLGVSGLAITTGSLFCTVVYLLPVLALFPPEAPPAGVMWLYVFILGAACTGLAYVLFYRLIMRMGAYQTLTVTYLVPVFSMLYGAILLAESVTSIMIMGAVLVLLGVAVTTGRLNFLTSRLTGSKG